MTRLAAQLFAFAFMGPGGVVYARDDWWSRTDDIGSDPVTRTTHEAWDFSPTGRVEVDEIGGSVEVSAGDARKVEFSYERRAASERDYNCETLKYEHDQETLRIWMEHKRGKECQVVRARDKLVLAVPRGARVELGNIGDSVKVTGVEGLVRLDSVGDSAILKDVQQVEADSIGDTLKIDVSKVGEDGIDIDSVGDSVELTLAKNIDARLRINSVGDEIRGPGLRLDHGDDDEGYEAELGKGGPLINIDSVGDSVVISGPDLKGKSDSERRRERRRHRDRDRDDD